MDMVKILMEEQEYQEQIEEQADEAQDEHMVIDVQYIVEQEVLVLHIQEDLEVVLFAEYILMQMQQQHNQMEEQEEMVQHIKMVQDLIK